MHQGEDGRKTMREDLRETIKSKRRAGDPQDEIDTVLDSEVYGPKARQARHGQRFGTEVVKIAPQGPLAYLVLRSFDYRYGPMPSHVNLAMQTSLEGRRVVIGSNDEADVVLSYRMQRHGQGEVEVISSRHAAVVKTNDGWCLWDLASTNGTYVNGKRVGYDTPCPHPLAEHDIISIKPYEFEFLEVRQ